MNVLDLPAEVAESCLEMAIALSQAAKDPDQIRAAWFVHRCYVRAVAPALSASTHELRWRRFINALGAYTDRCPQSPAALKLRTIVRENADLLERRAIAS